MAESSTIRGNKAESGPGGGISVRGGTFKMSGTSSISANTALQSGGGLYALRGILTGVDCGPGTYANVYGNSPNDCFLSP